MIRNQSIASQKRERQRSSPKTLEFKAKVSSLLLQAKPEVAYAIKRDLSIMTNMPFYKDRPAKVKITLTHIDLVKEYINLFCTCSDKDFVTKLIKRLSVNQGQTIRKLAPKIGEQKDIWEHAIPTKFVVNELIKMIVSGNTSELPNLLDLYCKAGQRGVTNEEDKLLKQFRASMPPEWNWKDANVDPLARHRLVGIFHL